MVMCARWTATVGWEKGWSVPPDSWPSELDLRPGSIDLALRTVFGRLPLLQWSWRPLDGVDEIGSRCEDIGMVVKEEA